MKVKRYLALMFTSAVILGAINNLISFVMYPLYVDASTQMRPPVFYMIMTFALSIFHSMFLVGLYILLRDRIPGRGYVKGMFYGVGLIWLLGPVFAISFEFAYNLTVQKSTMVFATTTLFSWVLYALVLETLYGRVYAQGSRG